MNIQQLRAQIVALQDATMDENKNFHSSYDEGKFDALSAVDALLDSLQEEPVSKDLEEAAVEAFKHIVDSDKNSFLEIFKAGAKWKEKQMMKEAVDAKIGSFVDGTIYDVDFNIDSDLRADDKIKVIIIKNE